VGAGGLGEGGVGAGGVGDGVRPQRIMQTTLLESQLMMQSGRSGPLPMHPNAQPNTCVKQPIMHCIMPFRSSAFPPPPAFGAGGTTDDRSAVLVWSSDPNAEADARSATPAAATRRRTRMAVVVPRGRAMAVRTCNSSGERVCVSCCVLFGEGLYRNQS
jgi:hypothetical protein